MLRQAVQKCGLGSGPQPISNCPRVQSDHLFDALRWAERIVVLQLPNTLQPKRYGCRSDAMALENGTKGQTYTQKIQGHRPTGLVRLVVRAEGWPWCLHACPAVLSRGTCTLIGRQTYSVQLSDPSLCGWGPTSRDQALRRGKESLCGTASAMPAHQALASPYVRVHC